VKLHFRRRKPLSLPELTSLPPSQIVSTLRALKLDRRGKAIVSDVLPEIESRLRFLDSVGLGYLALDRPTLTLSGGEAQRIRLAAQLAAIFPMILDLALPQLIGGLGAFQVPELVGLQIDVTAITAVDNKAFLAIYGELEAAGAMARDRVETTAVIVGQDVPGTDTFDSPERWTRERRPRFELALGGSEPDLEWSVRIGNGTWSAWSAAPRRTLSSNLFWLQGKHPVEVRARRRGEPRSADLSPVLVTPVIDTMPPVPSLETDGSLIRISGVDSVSGDKLSGRWRLRGGPWHDVDLPAEVKLGKAQPIELDVEVYDEAGNMAPTRGSQAIFRADFHGAPGESGCNCGASADPRASALLLALVALFLLRRRRRPSPGLVTP
jgi:MYXO-CTERM domain-containing protein